MEKMYYFNNTEGKLVSFKTKQVRISYNRDESDWVVKSVKGNDASGNDVDFDRYSKLYKSVEDYKNGNTTPISAWDVYAKFATQHVSDGSHSFILYYGNCKEINMRDEIIVWETEKDETSVEELESIDKFYADREKCAFAHEIVVKDEDGETTIPSERSKFVFTDEQRKVLDNIRKAFNKAKELGIGIYYDCEQDNLAFFDKKRLVRYCDVTPKDCGRDLTDLIYFDTDIVERFGIDYIGCDDRIFERITPQETK